MNNEYIPLYILYNNSKEKLDNWLIYEKNLLNAVPYEANYFNNKFTLDDLK